MRVLAQGARSNSNDLVVSPENHRARKHFPFPVRMFGPWGPGWTPR